MYGRVHPYALTWQIDPGDGQETGDNLQDYIIPALIVCDQGYQPIAPRTFATPDTFPATPPIVTFTGPVLGSDRTLLLKEAISGLRDMQRKCCGFVQLSTFITTRNPTKPPFRHRQSGRFPRPLYHGPATAAPTRLYLHHRPLLGPSMTEPHKTP
ncbi:hypothetical protein BKA56DRAFT_596945 [Ilyonectria sp. MPI-CAGE-AT-0026]|nr:hypothetical protein BKA56DRAFT_596945 [Ilyonectria sp. MPI-CAGE-AT-0026]